MAYSRLTKTYDGVTDEFAVSFAGGFLSRSDVTAYVSGEVDGNGDQLYRDITWINDGLLRIDVSGLEAGAQIVLERTVDKVNPIHDYADGANFIEENLDQSMQQLMHMVQEVLDGRFAELSTDISMGSHRITGLADPVDEQDAVNKRTLDAQTAAIDLAAIAGAVSAAEVAQVAAEGSASATAADVVTTNANVATTAANVVQTGADVATISAWLAALPSEDVITAAVDVALDAVEDRAKVYVIDASAGPVTVTLPLGADAGEPWHVLIQKGDNTTNTVTVVYSGSDQINSVSEGYSFSAQFDGARFSLDTSNTPSNWVTAQFGAAVGDATPIGTIRTHGTFTVAPGELPCNGAATDRVTFVDLFEAVTDVQSGSLTSGSAVVTGLTDTSYLIEGKAVEGASIPAGTTLLSIDSSTQVTLSANATATSTEDVRFFKYGNGDGSTTFNLPTQEDVADTETLEYVLTEFAADGTNAGATYSKAHGFPGEPTNVKVELVCTTAGDGYAVDEVLFAGYDAQYSGSNDGCNVSFDATNLNVQVGSAGRFVFYTETGAANNTAASTAKFNVRVTAEYSQTRTDRLYGIKAFTSVDDPAQVSAAAVVADVAEVKARSSAVQSVQAVTAAALSGTTSIPKDDTIPQITEGDEYLTVDITPVHADSVLEIDVELYVSNTTVAYVAGALFRDGASNAAAVGTVRSDDSAHLFPLKFTKRVTAGSTSLSTFTVRVGSNTGTTRVNSTDSGRLYGGVLQSSITVTEYAT